MTKFTIQTTANLPSAEFENSRVQCEGIEQLVSEFRRAISYYSSATSFVFVVTQKEGEDG